MSRGGNVEGYTSAADPKFRYILWIRLTGRHDLPFLLSRRGGRNSQKSFWSASQGRGHRGLERAWEWYLR